MRKFKNNAKKLLVCFLILFATLTLCGCGAISYNLEINASTGAVTQSIYFSVEKSSITTLAGKKFDDSQDPDNFKYKVITIANTVFCNMCDAFDASHADDDIVKTFQATQTDGGEKRFADVKLFVHQSMSPRPETRKADVQWAVNGDIIQCNISLTFSNIYAYYYFNDVYADTIQNDDTIKEEHLFYTKNISEQTAPFSKLDQNAIAQEFDNFFGTNGSGYKYFDFGSMEYAFCYSTPNSKLHSDANYTIRDASSNTIHIWEFSAQQVTDADGITIHTYTVAIKAYAWYVLALIIALVVALVLWIICAVKSKNKNAFVGANGEQTDQQLKYFEQTSREIREHNEKKIDKIEE